ncbi:hypothetical protein NE237_021233 [Protea cynaroides]|uniref:non-specific serine/threonine protein kinase n=1 Tax=Protea cynaroides TaxID=273540 RepID=A0A9Q0K4P4_9MAGN|nr:hypothetical protein NE237_021233 [Protea cynaroides]
MSNSSESSGSTTGSPLPPDQKSPPADARTPPTGSPPPPQEPPPPTNEQSSPPPISSNATSPPGSPSSSSPPASTPSGSTPSPPSFSSPPPPVASLSPPESPSPAGSGSSRPPPPSHPTPPQGSPTSPVPTPPASNSAVAQPPPASPTSSSPSSAISPPPNSPATTIPTPPASEVPAPPIAENLGPPPPQIASLPSAESPPKAVPSPQTPGSLPATSTQTPTPSNVPSTTSTTPASQNSNSVPKLSPPSTQSPSNSSTPSRSSTSSKSSNTSEGGSIVGMTVAGVVIIAFFAIFFVARRKKKQKEAYIAQYKPTSNNLPGQPDRYYYKSHQNIGGASGLGNTCGSGAPDTNVIGAKSSFSYEEMTEITNGFSRQNILGEGGFGCVYKGWLPDGRIVAVKELKEGSGQGEREFQAEVEIISRVHHRHLVSLVGYCIADRHRLLVYEFVSNNTLEYHLHGKGLPVMEWSKRVKIALGAARGLAYLHEDYFGLAKLTDDNNTHVSTRVMGTFGYMAPEYASSGKLTDRSDVFSFGVVLLEIVTGRISVDPTQPLGDESLAEWARPLLIHALDSRDLEEIVDPRLEKRYVESEMFRMIETAAACIRHSAQKRPRMSQVVRALDTESETSDLSNGVKYGHSTVFQSEQYSAEIQKFRMVALGSDSSDYSIHSGENNSREIPSKSQNVWSQDGSSEFSSGSKLIPLNKHNGW